MTDELSPLGPELEPDSAGAFDNEEAGSEDASHMLPPIRELPGDREFVPGAFYALQLDTQAPADPPQQFGELLGQALFRSLTDVHLFGRATDSDPWLEVGPLTPETPQILVAQELLPATGVPLAEDDFEMFSMVAGRVAKTLKRALQPPAEDAAAAATRSQALAALKGTLDSRFGLALSGDFDLADVTDACLCLGLKRHGGGFAWTGRQATAEPIFLVHADGAELAPGASGRSSLVNLTFCPAGVRQPGKVLERAFAAALYMQRRLGGTPQMLDGSEVPDTVARGEHPALTDALQKLEEAGLHPGHIITRRLL
jgi:hypothetical protein